MAALLSPLETDVDAEPGKPFTVDETGWGEFEITIKMYYATESGEKPQTIYHHLRLHPYGRTDEEREAMASGGEVRAWVYEEQVFNEPFEAFYEVLTTGAHPKGHPGGTASGSKGAKGKGKPVPPLPDKPCPDAWERSAMIPSGNKPGQEFSHDTQNLEIRRLREAQETTQKMSREMLDELKEKEALLARLKKENQEAAQAANAANAAAAAASSATPAAPASSQAASAAPNA